jgi:hypothetical protein
VRCAASLATDSPFLDKKCSVGDRVEFSRRFVGGVMTGWWPGIQQSRISRSRNRTRHGQQSCRRYFSGPGLPRPPAAGTAGHEKRGEPRSIGWESSGAPEDRAHPTRFGEWSDRISSKQVFPAIRSRLGTGLVARRKMWLPFRRYDRMHLPAVVRNVRMPRLVRENQQKVVPWTVFGN